MFSQNGQKNPTLTKAKVDSVNNLEFPYIISHSNKCLRLFSENAEKSKQIGYKLGLAKSLSLLSLSYYYLGKYDSSFYYSLQSIKVFEQLEKFNEAGNEYAELGYRYKRTKLETAFFYIKKGIELLENYNDTTKLISAYNNIGYLYELDNKIDSASYFYSKSQILAELNNSKVDISYALMSIAGIDIIKNDFTHAEKTLNNALNIRIELNDKTGIAETYAAFGELFIKKNEPEKAIMFFKKSLDLANELAYLYYQQYCFERLSFIYEKNNNYEKALFYHKQFIEIKDSIYSTKSKDKINELEIEFRTEKKEKEIALQKIELKDKELKLKGRNYLLYLALILVIFILLIFYGIYKKQRFKQKKLQEETLLKEQLSQERIKNRVHNERLRISRDLHDNLGSYLTFIISSIENILFTPNLKKETLNEKLSTINEFAKITISEFRDTIWALNKSSLPLNEFALRVMKYFERAKNANSKIEFKVENKMQGTYSLNFFEGINLYRCIQEAVNNSIKHSNTKKIDIVFDNETNGLLRIKIIDYGKGFDKEKISSGNGINNLYKRISDINGEIDIESENGVKITIKIKKEMDKIKDQNKDKA